MSVGADVVICVLEGFIMGWDFLVLVGSFETNLYLRLLSIR